MADGLEPKVRCADVARQLERAIKPESRGEGLGLSVALVAERAQASEDTVLRVMHNRWQVISLDLADRLLVAVGSHLSECEVVE